MEKKFITALNQKEVRFILPEDHSEKEEKTSNTKLFIQQSAQQHYFEQFI